MEKLSSGSGGRGLAMNSGLLISFCNTPPYFRLKQKGRSPLGLLDYERGLIYWIKLPIKADYSGITGLTQDRKSVFVSYQSKNSGIIVLDKAGLGVKYWFGLPEAKDVHSVLVANGFLYVVSTGNDQVLRYKFKSGENSFSSMRILWKPKGSLGQGDTHHLNSMCKYEENFLVSAFGRRSGERWSSARNGYILDLKSGKKIVGQIYHPHSLFSDGKDIVFCESVTKSLKKNNHETLFKFADGYTRGVAKINDWWAVGLSRGRRVSRSTGLINSIADPGELVSVCRVVFLKKGAVGKENVFSFNFKRFHNEIYDVLALKGSFFVEKRNVVGQDAVDKVTGNF